MLIVATGQRRRRDPQAWVVPQAVGAASSRARRPCRLLRAQRHRSNGGSLPRADYV